MQGARLVLTALASLVELLDYPVNEPSLVRHRKVDGLVPQEPAIVHQQERGLEDQLFLVCRRQAEEGFTVQLTAKGTLS